MSKSLFKIWYVGPFNPLLKTALKPWRSRKQKGVKLTKKENVYTDLKKSATGQEIKDGGGGGGE